MAQRIEIDGIPYVELTAKTIVINGVTYVERLNDETRKELINEHENALQTINDIEAIIYSTELNWEDKHNSVFALSRARKLTKWCLFDNWIDTDGDYQDEVMSFHLHFQLLKPKAIELVKCLNSSN